MTNILTCKIHLLKVFVYSFDSDTVDVTSGAVSALLLRFMVLMSAVLKVFIFYFLSHIPSQS